MSDRNAITWSLDAAGRITGSGRTEDQIKVGISGFRGRGFRVEIDAGFTTIAARANVGEYETADAARKAAPDLVRAFRSDLDAIANEYGARKLEILHHR